MTSPLPGRSLGGPVPGAAGTNPAFTGLSAILATAAGLLAFAAVTERWSLLAWLAAVAGSSAALFWALSGHGRNPGRRVHRDGATITVVLRRAWPVAALLCCLSLGAFLGHAALAHVEDPLLRLAAAACALLLLAPVPDLLRAALTRCHITIGPETILVRSWTTEASVAWVDVEAVDVDTTIPSRPAVSIVSRPGSTSLRLRRRRILVPLEPRPPAGQVVVNAVALDEPWMLAGRLDSLTDRPVAERAHLLQTNTVAMLTGR